MLPMYRVIGRMLYNIPIGAKYFQSEMIMLYKYMWQQPALVYVYTRYKLQTWSYILQKSKKIDQLTHY